MHTQVKVNQNMHLLSGDKVKWATSMTNGIRLEKIISCVYGTQGIVTHVIEMVSKKNLRL